MMGIKTITYIFIPTLLLFFSCNKDEDPIHPNTLVINDTSLYTGELLVQVKHWDGSNNIPSSWAFVVNLYFSREDAEDDFPYLSIRPDKDGLAYFGFLNMGNYYIKGYGNESGQPYQSLITPVQVMPRRLSIVNLSVQRP